MAIFFLIAAALIILSLLILLPSLVRSRSTAVDAAAIDRDQINVSIVRQQLDELAEQQVSGQISDEELATEKGRLERDLAAALGANSDSDSGGRWLVWPLAAIVPLLAGWLYLTIGTPAAINPASRTATAVAASTDEAPDMNAVIARIQRRVQEQPQDAQAWFMLGRAYMNVGEFGKAEQALRSSLQVDNDNVEVMVRLADALAMSRRGDMRGEPMQLLQRALQSDPDNVQALWLGGLANRAIGNNDLAVAQLQKLLPQLQDDPRSSQEVRQIIADIQAGGTVAGASAETQSNVGDSVEPGPAAASLAVSVQLAAALEPTASNLPPETVVFVYARAVNGPPMPLAVQRRQLSDLPFELALSEGNAMVPGMTIGNAGEVVVGARISLSGQAIAGSGDLMGEVSGIDARSGDRVQIEISEIVD